jgi:hypothetical protein
MISHCPQDLGIIVLLVCCALAGVEVLNQEDESQEVSRAQGAGAMAVEIGAGSSLACDLISPGDTQGLQKIN